MSDPWYWLPGLLLPDDDLLLPDAMLRLAEEPLLEELPADLRVADLRAPPFDADLLLLPDLDALLRAAPFLEAPLRAAPLQ